MRFLPQVPLSQIMSYEQFILRIPGFLIPSLSKNGGIWPQDLLDQTQEFRPRKPPKLRQILSFQPNGVGLPDNLADDCENRGVRPPNVWSLNSQNCLVRTQGFEANPHKGCATSDLFGEGGLQDTRANPEVRKTHNLTAILRQFAPDPGNLSKFNNNITPKRDWPPPKLSVFVGHSQVDRTVYEGILRSPQESHTVVRTGRKPSPVNLRRNGLYGLFHSDLLIRCVSGDNWFGAGVWCPGQVSDLEMETTMGMRRSTRQELRKLREIVREVFEDRLCPFCKESMLDTEDCSAPGNGDGSPFNVEWSLHHKDGDHHNNERSNRVWSHRRCHKSFHLTERHKANRKAKRQIRKRNSK